MESKNSKKQSQDSEKYFGFNSLGSQTIISLHNMKSPNLMSENYLNVNSQESQSIKSSPRKKHLRKTSSFRSKKSNRSSFSRHRKSKEPDYEGMIHAFLLSKYIALGTMNYMDDEEPKEDEIFVNKHESPSLNFLKK